MIRISNSIHKLYQAIGYFSRRVMNKPNIVCMIDVNKQLDLVAGWVVIPAIDEVKARSLTAFERYKGQQGDLK
jgi:hypothetical protein